MPVLTTEIDSLSQEIYSKNGQQKKLHSVVKNIPFNIKLSLANLTGEASLTFHDLLIEATLLYDSEPAKAVDFIKSNPLEYTTKILEDCPTEVFVETTVKVLSSQHEDSFFVILFSIRHAQTREILEIHQPTEAMKVVSKVHQALHPKPKPKKTGGVLVTGETPSLLKKRTFTETMVDTICRVEEKQLEQQNLISTLIQTTQLLQNSLNVLVTKNIKKEPEVYSPPVEEQHSNESLEYHLNGFLKQYQALTPQARPEKVRKLVNGLSLQETEIAREFINLFISSGQQPENSPEFLFCFDLDTPGIFGSIDLNVP
eukprot:TRINITY_DN142_c0_g3_i1.p1 TRINITY_DN142_c0_g3~~TRINITY_DN142_c0_g3_i1.p1  ORF type:complete len:314 (-),score=60.44 TRINITY_DN142_c0_g3_i1:444-1385(-)